MRQYEQAGRGLCPSTLTVPFNGTCIYCCLTGVWEACVGSEALACSAS